VVVLGGGAFSYERGTPVFADLEWIIATDLLRAKRGALTWTFT